MSASLAGMDAVRDRMPLARLARAIGITRSAVAQWERVPAERLGEVALITGILPRELRPDLFTPTAGEQAMTAAVLASFPGLGTVLGIEPGAGRLTFSLDSLPLLLGAGDLQTLKLALAAALPDGDCRKREKETDGEHIARLVRSAAGLHYARKD